jgi:hypothetical protein
VRRVSFCGVDEVAEIAYLSLRETGIELATVMDDGMTGEPFFGVTVISLEDGISACADRIVISSFKRGEALREKLLRLGAGPKRICAVGGAKSEERG